jgi:hypothetical protein
VADVSLVVLGGSAPMGHDARFAGHLIAGLPEGFTEAGEDGRRRRKVGSPLCRDT